MARIKTRWHNAKKLKPVETIAGAMAMNIWKMASDSVNKMYSGGFNFRDNAQLLDVIGEINMFLLQLADRIAYEELGAELRQRFTQALANHLIRTMIENQVQELGPSDQYQAPLLERLNERLDGYSEFAVLDGDPSYPMLRYFGTLVDAIMGGENNKWVIEHIMEVEAPGLIKTLKDGMAKLLPQTDTETDSAESS